MERSTYVRSYKTRGVAVDLCSTAEAQVELTKSSTLAVQQGQLRHEREPRFAVLQLLAVC